MAIQVNWVETHSNLLRGVVGNKHSWDELYFTMDKIKEEDAKASQNYHIIFMIEGKMPAGNPIPHFQAMYRAIKSLKHVGYVINIVEKKDIFPSKLLGMVMKTSGLMPNVLFAESVEKAIEQIRKTEV